MITEIFKNVKVIKKSRNKEGIEKHLLSNGIIVWKSEVKLSIETKNYYFNYKNIVEKWKYLGKSSKTECKNASSI